MLIAAVLNAQNNNYFVHTVDKGQSLFSISRMYQKSIQEIIALNPGCDVKLSIGQQLRIPQAAIDAEEESLGWSSPSVNSKSQNGTISFGRCSIK